MSFFGWIRRNRGEVIGLFGSLLISLSTVIPVEPNGPPNWPTLSMARLGEFDGVLLSVFALISVLAFIFKWRGSRAAVGILAQPVLAGAYAIRRHAMPEAGETSPAGWIVADVGTALVTVG